jgi:hypothetical protein
LEFCQRKAGKASWHKPEKVFVLHQGAGIEIQSSRKRFIHVIGKIYVRGVLLIITKNIIEVVSNGKAIQQRASQRMAKNLSR